MNLPDWRANPLRQASGMEWAALHFAPRLENIHRTKWLVRISLKGELWPLRDSIVGTASLPELTVLEDAGCPGTKNRPPCRLCIIVQTSRSIGAKKSCYVLRHPKYVREQCIESHPFANNAKGWGTRQTAHLTIGHTSSSAFSPEERHLIAHKVFLTCRHI